VIAAHDENRYPIGAGKQEFLGLDTTDLVADRPRAGGVAGALELGRRFVDRLARVQIDRLRPDIGCRVLGLRFALTGAVGSDDVAGGRVVLDQSKTPGRMSIARQLDRPGVRRCRQAPGFEVLSTQYDV
jgi:hypothetical protein